MLPLTSFGISLGTASVLLGLATLKLTNQAIKDCGLWSEEVFRGDRLPVLPFPCPDSESNSTHD